MGIRTKTKAAEARATYHVAPRTPVRTSLANALFSATQQRVLGLLFGQPERSFFATELISLAGAGSGAVQREIQRLVESGLVTVVRVGNQKHYQANRAAPIFDELAAIVEKIMQPSLSKNVSAFASSHAAQETRVPYNVSNAIALAAPPQRKLAALCRRHHITRLGIFGSAARGDAKDGSDVDLLVEFKRDSAVSLFDMVRMQEEFSRLFGRKVDLATATVLENPYRRQSILKDLRELYAA